MLLLPVTTALLTFGSTLTIVLLTCCNGCKKRSKKKATNKNKEKGALDTRSDAEPTAETQQLAPAPFPYQIQLLQPPFTPMPSTDATQQQQAAQRQDATGTTNEQTAQQKSAGGNTAAQPTTTQMLPPMMMMGAQPGQPTLQLEVDDSLCVTVALKKNKIVDIAVIEDDYGYRFLNQKFVLKTIKELMEFYWCRKYGVDYRGVKLRLDNPILRPIWLLTNSDVTFANETLGQGAFGTVFGGELIDVTERVPVAIKQLNDDLPPDEVMDLWKEASIMRNLQHRNIIQFYGIINERKPFALVMEKINGPSVESFLRNEGKDADNLFRMKILIDAARGMKYLHSQQPPFLHLDFASRNLLINWTARRHSKENCIVKVADFGMSRKKRIHKFDNSKPTNIRWICPDTFKSERADSKTDVYAFGVTIFELFRRPYRRPYGDWSPNDVLDKVIDKGKALYHVEGRPNGMPTVVYEIMKSCMYLGDRRDSRPSFEQLQHSLEQELARMI